MPDLFLIILGGVLLAALGGGLGFWLGQKRGRQDAAKAGHVQQEYDAYRRQVADHFGATAGHFQALGLQVKELYDHMATGADTLCDGDAAKPRIDFRAAVSLQPPGDEQADTIEETSDIVVDEAAEPVTEEVSADDQATETQPADFELAAAEEEDTTKRRYH